jgi:hypothetical protein
MDIAIVKKGQPGTSVPTARKASRVGNGRLSPLSEPDAPNTGKAHHLRMGPHIDDRNEIEAKGQQARRSSSLLWATAPLRQ